MNEKFEAKEEDIHREMLEAKGYSIKPMTGVLIFKREHQIGQKPNSRSFLGVATIPSGKFVVYGGSSTTVLNDLRTLEADNMEWKLLMQD